MIKVVEGDSRTFSAYAFGTPHQADLDWFKSFAAAKMATYSPWAQEQFSNYTNEVFNINRGQQVLDIKRSLNVQEQTDWYVDEIRHLENVDEVCNAPPAMIEWIMAEPTIRKSFMEQKIAGFDEEYQNHCPEGIGEDHYFYRVAMEGLAIETPDGDCVSTQWFDELLDPSHKLSIVEQAHIQGAWAIGLAAITEGVKDPTSRYGADL